MKLNRNDPQHLRERADRLRDEARTELDGIRRKELRDLAVDLDRQARDADRLKGS